VPGQFGGSFTDAVRVLERNPAVWNRIRAPRTGRRCDSWVSGNGRRRRWRGGGAPAYACTAGALSDRSRSSVAVCAFARPRCRQSRHPRTAVSAYGPGRPRGVTICALAPVRPTRVGTPRWRVRPPPLHFASPCAWAEQAAAVQAEARETPPRARNNPKQIGAHKLTLTPRGAMSFYALKQSLNVINRARRAMICARASPGSSRL